MNIIADIPAPILGWDFQRKFKLSTIWSDTLEEVFLVDKLAGIKSKMRMERVPFDVYLDLATIEEDVAIPWKSYQQWSQIQTQLKL